MLERATPDSSRDTVCGEAYTISLALRGRRSAFVAHNGPAGRLIDSELSIKPVCTYGLSICRGYYIFLRV